MKIQATKLSITLAAAALWIAPAGAQTRGGRGGGAPAPLKITISDFSDGGEIPAKYTCAAQPPGGSPQIQWTAGPEGTATYALILHDGDVHIGKAFEDVTHWIIWNIPASEHQLPANVPAQGDVENGARQGNNVARRVGYMGPCPPAGLPHHYNFMVYALDTKLDVPAGASRADLEKAMDGHVLASGEYVGLFHR